MVKAKKSYGQHFLIDHPAAQSIVNALDKQLFNVLEIGPGTGVLTQYLLQEEYEQYRLIELDPRMVKLLKKRFPTISNALVKGDALRVNWSQLFDGPFQVIGNFPYNISSQLLFHLLEEKERIPVVVGMFQRELAQRVCSQPGSKSYGVITILIQLYYQCDYLFELPPEAFDPPPRVFSAVIKLTRIHNNNHVDYESLRKLVKKAFAQRRKKIKNTLKGEPILAFQGFEKFSDMRPEQLTVENYIYLNKNNERLK